MPVNHEGDMGGTIWIIIKRVIATIGETNMSLTSAGVAFFSMLSLFPALAALISITGLMLDPAVVLSELENIRELFPEDVYSILRSQIIAFINERTDHLGWASLLSMLVAIWSARAGVGAMMVGLNSVQGQQNRALTLHYLRALLLTVALVAVGIIAILGVVIVPVTLSFVPLGPYAALTLEVVRWAVTFLVVLIGISLLYRYGPNQRPSRSGLFTSGAIFAVISWTAVSVLFSIYVADFANYNKIYGSVAAVIAMLIWLWLSSFLVLLGAALNYQIDQARSDMVPVDQVG